MQQTIGLCINKYITTEPGCLSYDKPSAIAQKLAFLLLLRGVCVDDGYTYNVYMYIYIYIYIYTHTQNVIYIYIYM